MFAVSLGYAIQHYLWTAGHIVGSFLLLQRKSYSLMWLLPLTLVIFAYILKPDTYDLVFYRRFFSMHDFGDYESGFVEVSKFLIGFKLSGNQILLFWQILITAILVAASLMLDKVLSFEKIALATLSLFALLSTQNALRQGIATAFLLFGLAVLAKGRVLIGIGIMMCSKFFHSHAWVFIGLVAPILLAHVSSQKVIKKYSENIFLVAGVVWGAILLFLVRLFFNPDSIYLNEDYDWGNARFSSESKLLVVGCIYLITRFLGFNCRTFSVFDFFFKIRTFVFGSLIFLCLLPEAFARILLFYFSVEAITLTLRSPQLADSMKFRVAASIIILAYGFAPNALNIFG